MEARDHVDRHVGRWYTDQVHRGVQMYRRRVGVPVEERDLTVDQEPRNRTLMTEPLVHVGLTV